ncbi:MAG: c-type cytochrome [Acidobacteria bacterium]|nr:MAG: c-type cytochrome [Acidobacteriota bacterium]
MNFMRMALPLLVAAASIAVASAQTPSPSPMPSGPPAAPAAAGPSGSPPPYAADNERHLAEVQKAIAGKEDKPAKEVFKNVLLLGDLPAGRVPRTMQGFTRSLGVACTHCHVAGDWDSEDKDDKQVTRDMMKMTKAINDDYIKPIKAIAEDRPNVTCFMCHRGQAKAGADLRPPGPRP